MNEQISAVLSKMTQMRSSEEIDEDFPALDETDDLETSKQTNVVLTVPPAQPPPPAEPPTSNLITEEELQKQTPLADRLKAHEEATSPKSPPSAKADDPEQLEETAQDSDDMELDSSDDENATIETARKRPLSKPDQAPAQKKRKYDPSQNKMKLKIRNKSRKLLQPSAKAVAATMEDYIYKRHSSTQNWDQRSFDQIGDLKFKGPCLPNSEKCYVYKVNDCLSRFKSFPFLVTLLTQELLSFPDLLNMSENEISNRRSQFEAEIKLECEYAKYFKGSTSSKLVGTIKKYYANAFEETGDKIAKIIAAHPDFAALVPDKLTLKKLVTTAWTDLMVKEYIEKYGSKESPKTKQKEKKGKVDFSCNVRGSEASEAFNLKLKQLGGSRFSFSIFPKDLEMTGRMGYSDLEKHLNKLRKSTSRHLLLFHAYVGGEEGAKFVKYLKKLKRLAFFKLQINKELYHLYICPNPKCFKKEAFQKMFQKQPTKMWACIDFPRRKKKSRAHVGMEAKKKLSKIPDVSKKGLTEESVSSLLSSLSDLIEGDDIPPKRSFVEALNETTGKKKVRSPPRDPRLPVEQQTVDPRASPANVPYSPMNPQRSPHPQQSPLYPSNQESKPVTNPVTGVETYPPPEPNPKSAPSPRYPQSSPRYEQEQATYQYGQFRQARRRPAAYYDRDRGYEQDRGYERRDVRQESDSRQKVREFPEPPGYRRRSRFDQRYNRRDERWNRDRRSDGSGGFSL